MSDNRFFWIPGDIPESDRTIVLVGEASFTRLHDLVTWLNTNLDHADWDYIPAWPALIDSKGLYFTFEPYVAKDKIVLFKLMFGGQ